MLCGKPTPETTRPRGKLGENTASDQNLRFRTAHTRDSNPQSILDHVQMQPAPFWHKNWDTNDAWLAYTPLIYLFLTLEGSWKHKMILVSNFCHKPYGDYERKNVCLFLFVFSGVAHYSIPPLIRIPPYWVFQHIKYGSRPRTWFPAKIIIFKGCIQFDLLNTKIR